MHTDSLNQQLGAYQEWREELAQTITSFQEWLEDHQLTTPEQELRLFEAIESLRKDKLTIAFVAEFSRGKTELINALFFAHYGQRLLASEAGRTTMCPSELFYDAETNESYIRLLPIESRRQDISIAELKHDPIQWTQIVLDTESPEQVTKALLEVVKTKQVPLERARELGLYDENQDIYFKTHGKHPEQVEIPHWRHALISFPHELLKQGLVVLDTPGLNALGNEPELTINMLPAAQSVMFLLGADTGVTLSDLNIWENHVSSIRQRKDSGLTIILNKIDTLWDELKSDSEIKAAIESQRLSTAEQLQIPVNQVFALSAQKGLLGKIRKDDQLLEKSGLPALERYLTEEILPSRQAIVRDNLVAQVGAMLNEHLCNMKSKEIQFKKQLDELRSIRGKNSDVIMHLVSKTQEEKDAYLKNVESFQSSRRVLHNQARNMLNALSIENLDKLIGKTRDEMQQSWTTGGMKRGMETFFDGARDTMEQVTSHAEQTRMLIRATYRKFHEDHGLPALTPRQFNASSYSTELERLYQEAETFRRSPATTMTEQGFVIKKFFITLVSHTRSLFYKANQDADTWLKEVMNPLINQINEHKVRMEKRHETLQKISESRDTVDVRIKELEAEYRDNRNNLKVLSELSIALDLPQQADTDTPDSTNVDQPDLAQAEA